MHELAPATSALSGPISDRTVRLSAQWPSAPDGQGFDTPGPSSAGMPGSSRPAPREQSRGVAERLLVGMLPRSSAAEGRAYLLLVEAEGARPRQALIGLGGWRKEKEGKWHLPRTRGSIIRLSEIDAVIDALQEARRIARERGWDTADDLPREGAAAAPSLAETHARDDGRPERR